MTRFKIANIFLWLFLIHFVIYNTYFGWNMEPINELEEKHDFISTLLAFIWIAFYLSPLFSIYEAWAKRKMDELWVIRQMKDID